MTSSIVADEDGTVWEQHDFAVIRFDKETPWQLRAHNETIGRYESRTSAAVAIEDKEHPEYLHIEERTEFIPIECNCGSPEEHHDDCQIIVLWMANR
jgi:hypothetical protein